MRPIRPFVVQPFRLTTPLPLRLTRPVIRDRRVFHHTRRFAHVDRIRIQQPRFTKYRLVQWASYTTVTLLAATYLLSKLLDGIEIEATVTTKEKDGEEQGEEEGEDGEEIVSVDDDDALFISMQYPKRLPGILWKQSDPEWQELSKFSKDRERQKVARKDLAEQLRTTVEHSMPLKQKIGADIKVSKVWLDFMYPKGPPPVYARKGLLMLEDEIAWSTQILPHAEYIRIRNMLWPSAVFSAMKNSLRLFYELQMVKVKGAVGIELTQHEKKVQLSARLHGRRRDHASRADANGDLQQTIQKQDGEGLGRAAVSQPPAQPSPSGSSMDTTKGVTVGLLERFPKVPILNDFAIASTMFIVTLMHDWQQAQVDLMPAGCCFVQGDVEVYGSLARCKLGVFAAYDIKANKYVWISSKPRRFFSRGGFRAQGGP